MPMLALRELQAAFQRAVQGEPQATLLAEIVEDGLTAGARLDIYRHHVLTTLTDVLMSAYPVVCCLVDPRFFAYAAHEYIREHLPTSPCLFEYGASFPAFLASFPPCRHLEYLPDVARLEWAVHAGRYADEAAALDPTRLAAVPPDETPWLVLRLDPSVAYVGSPWPIDQIWRANQPEGEAGVPVDLAAGGVQLEIRRHADNVVFRSLDASTFVFRRALAQGQPLAEAADRALALRADFPLAQAVRDLLEDGIAMDLAPMSPPTEVS
jgi:Putative DNA-binding domain